MYHISRQNSSKIRVSSIQHAANSSHATDQTSKKYSQLSIHIDRLPHPHFQLPHPLTRLSPFLFPLNRWLELIAPRTPPTIPIAIIVTEQIVPAGFLATAYFKWLIDAGEEFFCKVGREGTDAGEVGRCVGGGKTAEKVARRWLVL